MEWMRGAVGLEQGRAAPLTSRQVPAECSGSGETDSLHHYRQAGARAVLYCVSSAERTCQTVAATPAANSNSTTT